jgi:hypothetical protein
VVRGDHREQFRGFEDFDHVAPGVEMPALLMQPAGTEGDGESSIGVCFHDLARMGNEAARAFGGVGRKTPNDLLDLRQIDG